MVFPIGDDNTGRTITPLVNYVLIAANVLVFVLFQGLGSEQNRFTYAWATVPQEIVTGRDAVTPDRDALAYWASGLEPIYLDGAFARAS